MANIRPLEEQQGESLGEVLGQKNVKDFARQLERNPLLGGHLLEGITLNAAANTTINHKLGKQIRGWVPVDHDTAAATIYRVSWSATELVLFASAACTVSLWVF